MKRGLHQTIVSKIESRSNQFNPFSLLTVVVGIALIFLIANKYGLWDWARVTLSSVEAMRIFVASYGAWAPVVFFFAQILQVVLAPIPGGIAVVAGTLLFGVWGGLFLSVAGATAGSALLFLAIRRWGKPLALWVVGREHFERYADIFDKKGTLLFVILLVPFTPDDVVCALAGLSKISLQRFILFVAIGRTPSWFAISLVTADLASRSIVEWVFAGLAVFALVAVVLIYRDRLKRFLSRLTDKKRKL